MSSDLKIGANSLLVISISSSSVEYAEARMTLRLAATAIGADYAIFSARAIAASTSLPGSTI